MRSLLATLGLALLPALMVPEGLTLCLYGLVGIEKRAPGCACCRRDHAAQTTTLQSRKHEACCVQTPTHDTLASSSSDRIESKRVAAAPLSLPDRSDAPSLVMTSAPRVDAFLRDELRRPPPLPTRAPPLRL